MSEHHGHGNMPPTRALGGPAAILLFVLTLGAFVIQSSLTQVSSLTLQCIEHSLTFLVYKVCPRNTRLPTAVLSAVRQGHLPPSYETVLELPSRSYIAHSSLTVIFPIHLLYLVVTSRTPVKDYTSSLKAAFASRLSTAKNIQPEKVPFPTARLVTLVFAMAAGINIPGLLWYAAVSLAS